MGFLTVFFAVALLCCCLQGHIANAGMVHFDKHTSFESLVATSDSLWFVAFNYNIAEEKGLEEVEKLMDAMSDKMGSYDLNFGLLDCMNAENKKMCQAYRHSTNTPVGFSLFFDKPKDNPYTHVKYREPSQFPGIPTNNRDVEKFINKQLQPKNLKIVEFENVKTSVAALNSKPAVLIFSEKKSNPNLYIRSLVAKYSQVEVFFVPTPDKNSNIEEFHYDNLPSMFFVDPTIHEKAARFDGEMTDRASVSRWLDTVLSTSSIASSSTDAGDAGSSGVGSNSKAPAASKGIHPTKVTEEYLKTLLVASDQSSSSTSVGKADKTKSSHEAVVAVVSKSASAEIVGWDKALTNAIAGSVIPLEITCDADVAPETDSSSGDKITASLGAQLCSDRVEGHTYMFFIPYHAVLSPGKYYKLLSDQYKYKTLDNEDWVKIVGKTLPESAVEMLPEDENAINFFMQQSITKETLPVIIFSQKQVVSSVVRNAALGLQGKLSIGFVYISSDDSTLHQKFGAASLPAVIAMQPQQESEQMKTQRVEQEKKAGKKPNQPGQPQEDEDQARIMVVPRPYSTKQFGPLTFNNLKSFSHIFLETGFYPARAKKAAESQESSSSSLKTISPVLVEDQDEWSTVCPSSFRGLCIVYLHNGNEDVIQSGNAILNYLGSSDEDQSKTLREAMKLVSLNVACQYNFLSIFGIDQSALPMVIVISPFRLKYAIFRGKMSEKDVSEFVASIFKGQGSTAPLSSLPTIEDRETPDFQSCLKSMSDGGASLSAAADDEDARLNAEILEEIKKEEEEKKKRLVEEEKARKQKEKEDKLKAEQEKKKPATKKKKAKKAKKDEL